MTFSPKESAALSRLPKMLQAYWLRRIAASSGFERQRDMQIVENLAGVSDYLEGRNKKAVRNLITDRITVAFARKAAFYPPLPDWMQEERSKAEREQNFSFPTFNCPTGNSRTTGHGD